MNEATCSTVKGVENSLDDRVKASRVQEYEDDGFVAETPVIEIQVLHQNKMRRCIRYVYREFSPATKITRRQRSTFKDA